MFVHIDGKRINDWDTFHDVFAEAFGFPEFYGRNLNAWIDCLSSLDAPAEGMTKVHCEPGGVVTIALRDAKDLERRCPEQYHQLLECSAFVNWRRIERGLPSVLALAFAD